jgi:HAD superfamily hydrolase (TIGR01549 family)
MIYIFDLDGTLIDSVDAHGMSYVLAFKEIGKKISMKEANKLTGLGGKEIAKLLGAKDPDELYRRKSEIFIGMMDEVNEIKDATFVLNELRKRGHKVCLATSASRSNTEAAIEKFGWKFDMVVTRRDVENGKPSPDMINLILKKFPGPAVVVGDTEYDRKMAENAGVGALILGKEIKSLKDILKYPGPN